MENGPDNENQKISLLYSWWVIIPFIFIFFPIALLLIIRRYSWDKKMLSSSRASKIMGWISVVFGCCYLLAASGSKFENTTYLTVCIIFLTVGISLIIWSVKLKKQTLRYNLYQNLVIDHNMSSINNIASAAALNYDEVKKDLQTMIRKNYFTGAYINESSGEILLPRPVANTAANLSSSAKVPIVCKSCGANNTVFAGKAGECEYCGSPLN